MAPSLGVMPPHLEEFFSEMAAETLGKVSAPIAMPFYRARHLSCSFWHKMTSSDPSWSCDAIRGTYNLWPIFFFTEIVFFATELIPVDWNGSIMRDVRVGQKMATSNLLHCILTIRRSSEATGIGRLHAYKILWLNSRFFVAP